MNDDWYEEPESLETYTNYQANQVDETLETFEINGEVVSDRLKQLFQKAAQQRTDKKIADEKLDDLGSALKTFVLDMVKVLDYRDLGLLIGIRPEHLKDEIAALGIKVPIESARKWDEIDLGKFIDIAHCSRCQVQLNHHTFLVGIRECRKCYVENIKHWVKAGESISLFFKD